MKRVLPFIAVAAASAWSYQSSRDHPNALVITAIVCVVGMILMGVMLRRGFWRMADTVEDLDDRLVVTRWRTRIEIPIANIKAIRRQRGLNGSYVTVLLNTPSALGSEITFLAPSWRTLRDIEERLDSLAQRVATQRQGLSSR